MARVQPLKLASGAPFISVGLVMSSRKNLKSCLLVRTSLRPRRQSDPVRTPSALA